MSNFILDILEGVAKGLATAAEQQTTVADEKGLSIEADTFGQLMRYARVDQEISIRKLSDITGIPGYRLERYERDEWKPGDWSTFDKPSFDDMVAIKKALNISANSIRKFMV